MRKARLLLFAGGVAALGLLAVGGGGADTARASHGNLNIHVHDDFYHAAGEFLVGGVTDHTLAQAACQTAQPDPECDATIHVGDTLTFVAPAPLAANLHTVTECSDATFTNCGPSVSASNPIGDSGVRSQPQWPYGPVQFNSPGVFFYRCEVHPDVMRGRVQVVAANGQPIAVGGTVGLLDAGLSGEHRHAEAGPGTEGASAWVYGIVAAVVVALCGASVMAVRRSYKR